MSEYFAKPLFLIINLETLVWLLVQGEELNYVT